eukprot:356427-Chlamydomonas_euryale.AAC.3
MPCWHIIPPLFLHHACPSPAVASKFLGEDACISDAFICPPACAHGATSWLSHIRKLCNDMTPASKFA